MISEMMRQSRVATAEVVWNLLLDHLSAVVNDDVDSLSVDSITAALIQAAIVARNDYEADEVEVEILSAVDAERVMMATFEATMCGYLKDCNYTKEQAEQNWPIIDALYVDMPRLLAMRIGRTLGVKTAMQVKSWNRAMRVGGMV